MSTPRIVYSKHYPAPKRRTVNRQPPPTGGSGFGYVVAMIACLAAALVLVNYLGMRAEGPQTLEQLIEQLDREERERQGIEAHEQVSEVDPREAEYGYLAPLVACRDAYGPDCWDRIAPKRRSK